MTAAPLTTRLRPRHWILLDGVAVVFLALGWGELSGMPGPRPVNALIVAASVLPAGLRRLWPRATLAVVTAAGLLAISRSTDPTPIMAAAYVMYLIPLRCDRRQASRILAATLAVTLLGVVLLGRPGYSAPEDDRVMALAASAVFIAGAWILGYAVRQQRGFTASERRLREHEVQEAAERRIAEARRAHDEQRLEIARELHDVVAHAISVIAVQAGVANFVAAERPEEAARALASIEETSRGALQEMRMLLGVLRDDDAGRTPVPGLDGLDDLVSRAADAGVRVEVEVEVDGDGARPVLPAGLDLAAYRVVQEAVTNVIRHSGADSCRVRMSYEETEMRLEVTDDGASGPVDAGRVPGSGHGLAGMRERAAMYGGDVQAGPLPEARGFRVMAVFPLTPASDAAGPGTTEPGAIEPGPAEPASTAPAPAATPTEPR